MNSQRAIDIYNCKKEKKTFRYFRDNSDGPSYSTFKKQKERSVLDKILHRKKEGTKSKIHKTP